MNSQELRNLQEAYLNVYEEVDKRRAPKEFLYRLNASREGHMAQDGPNKPAYDAKQRLLKKAQKRKNMEEQTDLYDLILSHLLDEGYADTNDSALVIMSNMSEEWRESIIEQQPDPLKNQAKLADLRNTAFGSEKFQKVVDDSPSNPRSKNFNPNSLKTPGV